MRWLDTPPCVPLEEVERRPGRLLLRGPTLGYRVSGGAGAVFGGAAAAFGLRLSRVLPGPMKLVPLGIAAVGGAVAAVSSAQASVQVTVEVTASGLVARWRLPLLAEKELALATAEVAALEVKTVVRSERYAGPPHLPRAAQVEAELAVRRHLRVERALESLGGGGEVDDDLRGHRVSGGRAG